MRRCGAIKENVLVGVGVQLASALNGIGVVRAYFMIVTCIRHQTESLLRIRFREQIEILSLAPILLLGGFFWLVWIDPSHEVAERINHKRESDHEQVAHW